MHVFRYCYHWTVVLVQPWSLKYIFLRTVFKVRKVFCPRSTPLHLGLLANHDINHKTLYIYRELVLRIHSMNSITEIVTNIIYHSLIYHSFWCNTDQHDKSITAKIANMQGLHINWTLRIIHRLIKRLHSLSFHCLPRYLIISIAKPLSAYDTVRYLHCL